MTDSSSPAAPATDASASADPDRREDFLRTFLSRRQQMETLVSRRVGCRATAADLVQELFLRFWRRPTAPVEDLGTYLLRSAHNLAIDHLRSEGSRNRAESALLPEQQLAEPASPEAGHSTENLKRQIPKAKKISTTELIFGSWKTADER